MVQFAYSDHQPRRDHWKGVFNTRREMSPRIPSERVHVVNFRQDGGMLLYDTCSHSELLSFARNRKLNLDGEATQ